MAYVFKRVQDALGNEREEKTDIFAPQQGTTPTPGGEQLPSSGLKTSTEGELGAGMGGGVSTGGEGAPSDVKAADKALIMKNLGKTQAPRFAQDAQSTLSEADQKLQDEANQYVQGYKSKDYSIDSATLDKAIGGDTEAISKASGRLSQGTDRVDQFAPKTKIDYSDQINEFKTDEGLKNILRRESGPQYNAGEAAFDVMLLNRNADFQNIRSQLANKQADILKRANEMGGSEGSQTKAAQAAVEENLNKAKTGIRDYLGTREKDLIAAQQKELEAENAALAEMRAAGGGQYLTDQAAQALNALKSEYSGADPYGVAGYLDKSGVNAADFYGVRGDYADYRDFINADEASRFGNIYSLLGRSDDDSIKNSLAGMGPSGRGGFDAQSFKQALYGGAERANAQADAAAQAELDRLLGDIRSRYGSGVDSYISEKSKSLADQIRGEYGDDFVGDVDMSQFRRQQTSDLSGLNADEAARLNALSRELEQGDQFSAGEGFGSAFDADAYLNALRSSSDKKRADRIAEEQAKKAREGERTKEITIKTPWGNQTYKTGVKNKDAGAISEQSPSNPSNGSPSKPMSTTKEIANLAGKEVVKADKAATKADKATGGNVKNIKKSLCFPAGVRFKLEGGNISPIEMIAVGDVLEQGGIVTDRHFGVSDDMYLVNGVLVTGEHAVWYADKWLEAQHVPSAAKVIGEFEVYNVTCENHVMIHESGAKLGDFDRDAEVQIW